MIVIKKQNKYKAKSGNGFPSRLEEAVYNMLILLEKAGEIKDIKRQDCVHLTDAGIRCKIDFSFVDVKSGEKRYCEAKGFETERWLIIKKLWRNYGPGPLEIWGMGNYGTPKLIETIIPKT